jgi:RNA-directed DNA polymerase
MNLATPASVQKLQTALHAKAKGSPNFRFYSLYDKVYRKDVLKFAYECCKANGGAAGVDGRQMAERRFHGGRSRYANGRRIATRRADQPDLVQYLPVMLLKALQV